jgi:hypothetical protein
MKGKWLAVVAVASLCLNLAVVGAYFHQQTRRHGTRWPVLRGMNRETMGRLHKIREEAWPDFRELAQKDESAKLALLDKIGDPKVSQAEVESLCAEIGRRHGAMGLNAFWLLRSELEALPADRRAEYLEWLRFGMKQMMHGPMGQRGPWRGEEPPPPLDEYPLPFPPGESGK